MSQHRIFLNLKITTNELSLSIKRLFIKTGCTINLIAVFIDNALWFYQYFDLFLKHLCICIINYIVLQTIRRWTPIHWNLSILWPCVLRTNIINHASELHKSITCQFKMHPKLNTSSAPFEVGVLLHFVCINQAINVVIYLSKEITIKTHKSQFTIFCCYP